METRLAYCATCDRPVRVLVKNEAPSWPSPQELDPNDIVCLEHGDTCTGAMCPIFDVPSEQMKESLAEYRKQAGEHGAGTVPRAQGADAAQRRNDDES